MTRNSRQARRKRQRDLEYMLGICQRFMTNTWQDKRFIWHLERDMKVLLEL